MGIAEFCARTGSAHVAAPPRSMMNSRRLIPSPEAQRTGHRNGSK
jgi:hypothetical protein